MTLATPAERRVLKASFAGAAAATPILLAAIVASQGLAGRRGGVDPNAPELLAFIGVAAPGIGTLVSAFCLGLALLLFGDGRLSGWRYASAAALGAAAGAVVLQFFAGMIAGSWIDGPSLAVGALYGGCAASFWTRWSQKANGHG